MEGSIKNPRNMVQIQSRYFHVAFERRFSDVLLLRSLGNKIRNFMGTSRKKERKKKKLASDYINALLHTALKRKKKEEKKTPVGLHKCRASTRIKNSRRTTIRVLCILIINKILLCRTVTTRRKLIQNLW